MTDVILRGYDEVHVPGKRLGRLVEHDPRSREFPARMVAPAAKLKTLRHRRYGGIWDQGNTGSCTGQAAAGAANTAPIHKTGERVLKEADAISVYSLATKLDGFPGEWPPSDTGSSGLAAAKALKQMGLIDSYSHAFGIDEAIRALQINPFILGIDWLENFDTPTPDGFIRIGGQVRGGHELEVRGYVAARNPYVLIDNSWGILWGIGGTCKMFVRDLATMLDRQGDATVLR